MFFGGNIDSLDTLQTVCVNPNKKVLDQMNNSETNKPESRDSNNENLNISVSSRITFYLEDGDP